MVRGRRGCGVKLVGDAVGQRLAQLDAPLIEAVDLPDGALGEHEVLVKGDDLVVVTQAALGDDSGLVGAAGWNAATGLSR